MRLHASEHSEKFSRRTRVYTPVCKFACTLVYISANEISLGGFLHERQPHAATCNGVYSPGGVVT